MAPYPLQQPQVHLRQASKPTAPAPVHHHGHGNPKPDAVAASRRRGAPADARGLRALIKALSASFTSTAAAAAAAVHAHATKLGLDRERTVRNGLIALYLACGERAAAGALFDALRGDDRPDVVSWTAMVTGHSRLGLIHDAVSLFFEMRGSRPVRRRGTSRSPGRRTGASRRRVSRSTSWRGTRSWTCTPSAATWPRRAGGSEGCRWPGPSCPGTPCSRRSHAPASTPRRWHCSRRCSARACVRTARRPWPSSAQLGALDTGRWMHAYMRRQQGRDADADGVVVGNALLDMYAKCGAVDLAAAVFYGMARRDVYTYASMISGLATHGRADEALALFAAMRRAGVRPNGVALLGVLSACCHAGLFDEGLRHLDAMAEAYGVTPGIEHYGCAIDMLGRAGRLDEAEALVAAMPVSPDALIRGSLLAACRARGDVERAERVMRWRVVAVDRGSGEPGDLVLLSNMYASKGRHGRAVQVRKQMRRSKIIKHPGCSSIDIDGVVHEFRAVPANAIA